MTALKLITRNYRVNESRQRGASLLEGIAYLGIAAIVILGAVSLLTGAFGSAQSNRLSEEIISIRTGVKKLYMGQSTGYGAAGTNLVPILNTSRVLPSTLQPNAAGAVTNTFGGAVRVTGNGAQFTIVYTQVPQDVCINLITGASGWVSITGTGGAGGIAVFPATPQNAADECPNNAAAGNTITWVAS